jgi:hypothetical protein
MRSERFQFAFFFCLVLSLLWIIFGQASVAQADGPWYVSPAGDDDNTCQAPDDACQTIAAAVSKAAWGDAVIVAAGTYTEHVNLDKNLVLQGAGESSTIVDGNASGRVFTITAASAVIITGMAVTNGRAADGGGIRNDGTLALSDCTISGNTAIGADGDVSTPNGGDGAGGGIYNSNVLTLTSCSIISNTATGGNGAPGSSMFSSAGGSGAGGGIYSDGSLSLSGCTLDDNTANGGNGGDNSGFGDGGDGGRGQGGGIYITGALTLDVCTLGHNAANGGNGGDASLPLPGPGSVGGAGEGGGIYGIGTLTLNDCMVNGHTATGGEGSL